MLPHDKPAAEQKIFTVFLSSPGDVAEERAAAIEVLSALQRKDDFFARVALSVVAWDDPIQKAPVFLHETPQLSVNDYKRQPAQCDLTIVILWARLGSLLPKAHFSKADGSAFASGTEWEIEDALRAGKPVLAYWSQKPLPRKRSNDEKQQSDALDAFLNSKLRNSDGSFRGSVAEFNDLAEFKDRIESDVEQWLKKKIENQSARLLEPGREAQARPVPRSTLPNLGEFVGRASDLAVIDQAFANPSTGARLVLAGEPGVGKSHLASAWGAGNASRYPGGTFFIPFNADPVHHLAQLVAASPGEAIADQATRALANLREPTLLIYDNVDSEAILTPWLPPPTLPVHLLITSTQIYWTKEHRAHPVQPLSSSDRRALVAQLAGDKAAERYGDTLAERSAGVAVQLKAEALFVDYELQHGREPELDDELANASLTSFERAFLTLPADGKLAARAATLFNPAAVPQDMVGELLEWEEKRARAALDAVCDRGVATRVGSTLRIHGLMNSFLRGRAEPELSLELLARHVGAFVAAARAFLALPTSEAARARLVAFPDDFSFWTECQVDLADSLYAIGLALREVGRFSAAQVWFEQAVGQAEQGDANGLVDHARLGVSLHRVGYGLSGQGKYAEARHRFERAVTEKEKGDLDGRVDHESVGSSLHLVGYCLINQGQHAAAQHWFERAVTEKSKGNMQGRVDHASLGSSMQQVGDCLIEQGQYAVAQGWFEQAITEKRQGDVRGRVDHMSLGSSMHRVGYALSWQGQHALAESWFKKAIAEKEQGDVHGRVDHVKFGRSVHHIGYGLRKQGQCAKAQPWFEKAIAETKKGDVYGRVDHSSLGDSCQQIGHCLSSQGDYRAAEPWFKLAVLEWEQGDVHGRVDRASLALALRSWAACLRRLGQDDAATRGEERAATLEAEAPRAAD